MKILECAPKSRVRHHMRRKFASALAFFLGLAMTTAAPRVLACAACFGKSDSAMAKSLNAGIFSLMAVIATVLIGAASFFVFLARKAATSSEQNQTDDSPKA